MIPKPLKDLRVSSECRALNAASLTAIAKHPGEPMRISSPIGESVRNLVRCTIKRWEGEYLADKITGALYNAETGASMTESSRVVIGPADRAPDAADRNPFAYGYQQIKKRVATEKAAAREARGAPGGSRNGAAKVNEQIVRDIRTLKLDGTHAISISQASKLYGIAASTVMDIRKRRTWTEVV